LGLSAIRCESGSYLGSRRRIIFQGPEKRRAFLENVLAQAFGTALGAGLIVVAGLVAGLIGEVSAVGIVTGLLVVLVGLALLFASGEKIDQGLQVWELRERQKIIRDAEEKLRPMTPRERLRFFVPHPGGFAKAPWLLDGIAEPLRREVNESLLQARREEGEEV
jgi:hypothetical protein